jgi:hypothetical protein|tara:strand:- start:476 stop:838 length:363 start_codon:yes stop_codon:yes gene_type:complete
MSSPFQRQFSTKSPLNQDKINWNDSIPTNTHDVNKLGRIKKEIRKEKGFDKSVMTHRGRPLISTKPWRLLTSNKFNQPYGMGRLANAAVELGKNLAVPGRLVKKVKRAYDYYKHTQKPPH